ncbi:MAG: ABC transporter substrate-binding protein [Alphaproteobacteria bacterium]|nr:ABC transporter substrate-binding protein [Alphaproteobacteria bacterium]
MDRRWSAAAEMCPSSLAIAVLLGLGGCAGNAADPQAQVTNPPRPSIYAVERSGRRATLYAPTGEKHVLRPGAEGPPVSLRGPVQPPVARGPVPTAPQPPASIYGSPAHSGKVMTFVHDWARGVLAVVQDDILSSADRQLRLRRSVDRAFDVAAVARYALDDEWQDLTVDRRADYLDLFRDVALIEPWKETLAGERRVRIVGATPLAGETEPLTVVRGEVRNRSGVVSRIDWLVADRGPEFAIIDVITSGVSLRTERREEYSRYFRWRGGGIDALMRDLADRRAGS